MGRNRNKNLAESQFDFCAKPISLKKFIEDVQNENEVPFFPLEDFETEIVDLKPDVIETTVLEAKTNVALNVSLIKNLNSPDEIEDFNITELLYSEEVVELDPIINLVNGFDDEIKNKPKIDFQFKISDQLNVARRQIIVLKNVSSLSPKFCKEVLKIRNDLSKIEADSIHINSKDGLNEFKFHYEKSISATFPGYLTMDIDREISFLGNKFQFSNHHYHLMIKKLFNNFNDQPFPLDTKVKDFLNLSEIHPNLDLTIRSLFEKINVLFADDLLGEPGYSRLIIPISLILFSKLQFFEKVLKIQELRLKLDSFDSLNFIDDFKLYHHKYFKTEFIKFEEF